MTGGDAITREALLALAAAVDLELPAEDVDEVLAVVQGQLDRVAAWTDAGLDGPDPATHFDARW